MTTLAPGSDAMATMPSGEPTFLFVDLEGSTRLVQQLGDDFPPLLAAFHRVLSDAVADHDGVPLGTEGDGLSAVFADPCDAARAAIRIRHRLAFDRWSPPIRVRARIGINTGPAVHAGWGYIGLGVNRGAQVGAAAGGGQILLTAHTAELIAATAHEQGWTITDLGSFTLAEADRPLRLLRLDSPGDPADDTPPRAPRALATGVPVAPAPIIGRTSDLAAVSDLLRRPGARLVTITGPAGAGKTRLGLELARTLDPSYPGGVFFVDLSTTRTAEQLATSVGRTMGIRDASGPTVVDRIRALYGGDRVLVVLDNADQVEDPAAPLDGFLTGVEGLQVLVTSRAPVRSTFELEYPLGPLPLPPWGADVATVAAADAVTFFVDRARLVRAGFELTEENAAVIAEICRRLDGLPLALELAAARLRLFSPETLLERLDDRLGLLDRGHRDAPERHRTLRAAITWSYDLLDPVEQELFRNLAVFAGGWSQEGLVAVCGEDAPALVDALATRSLVVRTVHDTGTRHRLLETLRAFALERLVESGTEPELRRRHLAWCAQLARTLEEQMPTPRFPSLLEAVDLERHNLREALRWSLTEDGDLEEALRMAAALPIFCDVRGYVGEGRSWLDRLLAAASPGSVDDSARAAALGALGWLAMIQGDGEGSDAAFAESVRILRDRGEDRLHAWSLAMYGMTSYNRGRLAEARALFEEASTLGRRVGDLWLTEGWCQYGLGHVAFGEGDVGTATTLISATLEYSRRHGLVWGVGHAQLSLGVLALLSGDIRQAVERLSESLQVRSGIRDARGIADCLGVMAMIASAGGLHALSARLLAAVDVARVASGQRTVPWQQPFLDQAASAAREHLGESGFVAAQEEGRRLTTDEAVELALRQVPEGVPETPSPAQAGA